MQTLIQSQKRCFLPSIKNLPYYTQCFFNKSNRPLFICKECAWEIALLNKVILFQWWFSKFLTLTLFLKFRLSSSKGRTSSFSSAVWKTRFSIWFFMHVKKAIFYAGIEKKIAYSLEMFWAKVKEILYDRYIAHKVLIYY